MTSPIDINTKGIMAMIPASWRPYAQLMRLDRPIGWWLLVLPSWWSILTAGLVYGVNLLDCLKLMALFTIGAIVMRGAGCVVNDLWDRDLDRHVARTRTRALAAGLITPNRAIIFLAGLCVIGLFVLINLPLVAIWTGLASLPLIIIYPLAKRFFGLPQIVLAFTFGWGALLGWAAHGQMPNELALIMYLATAFWIFGYDTIYAIQDMADDKHVGIKSSALTLGKALSPVVAFCYLMCMGGMLIIGAMRDATIIYYLGLTVFAFHLSWQIKRIDLQNPEIAGVIFRSNRDAGLIVSFALIAEYLF